MIILVDAISSGYSQYIPDDEHVWMELWWPEPIPREKTIEWFNQQHENGAMLRDLQITMGEWAINKIMTSDKIDESERNKSVMKIRKNVENLKQSKTPISSPAFFGRENRRAYSEDDLKR